jgi:uncharacterized protein (TIGR01777 family)
MKIAIAGYRGFIGSTVMLSMKGHDWIRLERDDLYGSADALAAKIEDVDVLMNFAGYPISKRWSKKNQRKILESRIRVTRNLISAAEQCSNPPGQLIFTSAIGIYAEEGEHTEHSTNMGSGFLAEVVKRWEEEMNSEPLQDRMTVIRTGVVLGNTGGAFPRLKKLFRYYMGAVLGTGHQVYSFIHIDDLVNIIAYCIENRITSLVNGTAPSPVANREFSKALARALKRPLLFRIPGWMMRLLLGKSSAVILEGQTVYPERILKEGYRFKYPDVESACKNLVEQR